jgi:hypothetical protein
MLYLESVYTLGLLGHQHRHGGQLRGQRFQLRWEVVCAFISVVLGQPNLEVVCGFTSVNASKRQTD